MKKSIYSLRQYALVNRLKEARIQSKLSQGDVAKLLDVSQSFISKLESGQVKIDVLQLDDLAKIYKKTVRYFLK